VVETKKRAEERRKKINLQSIRLWIGDFKILVLIFCNI
jgi:hypothetical protein